MKGYKQINIKLANGLYLRPAKQYESDSSMINEVHDANLICHLANFLIACPEQYFTCLNTRNQECVAKQLVCDGANDCTDGSDEVNCRK